MNEKSGENDLSKIIAQAVTEGVKQGIIAAQAIQHIPTKGELATREIAASRAIFDEESPIPNEYNLLESLATESTIVTRGQNGRIVDFKKHTFSPEFVERITMEETRRGWASVPSSEFKTMRQTQREAIESQVAQAIRVRCWTEGYQVDLRNLIKKQITEIARFARVVGPCTEQGELIQDAPR